jgi:beta-carotene 15,15'-dioxygenase
MQDYLKSEFRLNLVCSFLAFLLIIVHLLLPDNLLSYFEWFTIILLILLTGLPHGSIDHLIYLKIVQKKENPQPKDFVGFLMRYLLLMLLYAVIWFFFPYISFIVFIFISAYHFGQSQLYFYPLKNSLSKNIFYISWGLGLLLLIFLNHTDTLKIYLNGFLPTEIMDTIQENLKIFIFLPLLLLLPWFLKVLWLMITQKSWLYTSELLTMLVLVFAIGKTSLLFSFIIYFGIWHSSKSLAATNRVLSNVKFWSLYKKALPFTIISALAIAGFLFFSNLYNISLSNVLIFFIGISLLTMPHIAVIDQIYSRIKS